MELFSLGLSPVVRSRSNPNWRRLRQDQVFYYKSRGHNGRRVLSIAFRFTSHEDDHQFALFYPYSPTNLYSYLNRLTVESERSKLGRTKDTYDSHQAKDSRNEVYCIEQLCTSVLSKPIHSITIYDRKLNDQYRPKVIVIGRLHGNLDSVSSYVCQGLVDFALCDHPVARFARKSMQLIVVPMLDPDSIIVGNTRTDIFGQSEMTAKLVQSNPNVYSHINRLVEMLKETTMEHRTILLELRVNVKLIGVRTVSILYNDAIRMERHLQLPRLFARFIESFNLEKCVFFEKGDGPHLPFADVGLVL